MSIYYRFLKHFLNIISGILTIIPQLGWAAETLDYRFERLVPQLEQPLFLKNPKGIAIAKDGSFWIADTYNNRIQHVSSSGQFIAQFGSLGNENGQLFSLLTSQFLVMEAFG